MLLAPWPRDPPPVIHMKLAVPDLISNSYFPAVAAVELGFFKKEGLDVALELVFPVDRAYRQLRDGAVDFVGGSAHSALAAFPEWNGVKLLCAQAQGMYWFLVMRADLGAARGDLDVVKGRTIGAAPWVEMGLRRLLTEAGIDLERDRVTIAPAPGAPGTSIINFGMTAARALEAGLIDGFWANGMGAEVAVRRGVGAIVLDVRRGDGPKPAFNYTMSSLAATDRLIEGSPEIAAAAVRALVATQQALKADVGRAAEVGRRAVSAGRGGADHRADPPRPALLRCRDIARICRRHEPVRPRSRALCRTTFWSSTSSTPKTANSCPPNAAMLCSRTCQSSPCPFFVPAQPECSTSFYNWSGRPCSRAQAGRTSDRRCRSPWLGCRADLEGDRRV